ncbi:hypothetical protein [Oceanibaculum indicum]|uniref:Uncharacterized protein n=1 Tax=Oceanibaculum indicum P24 TaxID=1207063 RepID=K2JNH4_9PROT|nr:hypothetical protein [Oceanibaculum indicum]EKE76828.1 hypothetical protein P24_06486 [Oceanibaculum indicum P24]
MTSDNSQTGSSQAKDSQARSGQDRQALGILAETVSVTLGMSNIVTREVRRAYESGRTVDLFTAKAAFNALPGWQRQQIGDAAEERAWHFQRVARASHRDWRELADREKTIIFPRLPNGIRPRESATARPTAAPSVPPASNQTTSFKSVGPQTPLKAAPKPPTSGMPPRRPA